MARMLFEYDPLRGGFRLSLLAPHDGVEGHTRSAFDGLLSLVVDAHNRIIRIGSAFEDHGGVPLRGIHEGHEFPLDDLVVSGPAFRIDRLQLRQTEESLELWFSNGADVPRDHWSERHDAVSGVTAWFSQRKALAGWPVPGVGGRVEVPMLAGLRFRPITAAFPITSLRLSQMDFK